MRTLIMAVIVFFNMSFVYANNTVDDYGMSIYIQCGLADTLKVYSGIRLEFFKIISAKKEKGSWMIGLAAKENNSLKMIFYHSIATAMIKANKQIEFIDQGCAHRKGA